MCQELSQAFGKQKAMCVHVYTYYIYIYIWSYIVIYSLIHIYIYIVMLANGGVLKMNCSPMYIKGQREK